MFPPPSSSPSMDPASPLLHPPYLPIKPIRALQHRAVCSRLLLTVCHLPARQSWEPHVALCAHGEPHVSV